VANRDGAWTYKTGGVTEGTKRKSRNVVWGKAHNSSYGVKARTIAKQGVETLTNGNVCIAGIYKKVKGQEGENKNKWWLNGGRG